MHRVAGGKAAAAVGSVDDGDAIVKVALEKFGGVHILVANAAVAVAEYRATLDGWEET